MTIRRRGGAGWPRSSDWVPALRDFGLLIGALALARLAAAYDPPIRVAR
jgi:hypothetical protein